MMGWKELDPARTVVDRTVPAIDLHECGCRVFHAGENREMLVHKAPGLSGYHAGRFVAATK
jgi:hypothetical protein